MSLAEGDWLRPIAAGLVGAVAVFALTALAARSPRDQAGWKRLVPSVAHWTGLVLGTGLVLVMGYVRLFVGSTRADAASQMTMLSWLLVVFALLAIAVALSTIAIRRRAVRWRGATIVWRQGGRERSADLSTLSGIDGTWLGEAVLRFEDGVAVKLDPYARGAQELLERAQSVLDADAETWSEDEP